MSRKLTRRQFLSTAAAVSSALALAACGATPTPTATPKPPTPVPPTATTVPPTATKPAATAAPAAPTATAAPPPPTATKAPPTPTPAPKVVTGGKVTIAMWNPPDNLLALNAKSSYALFPVNIIFETLVRFNDKLEFVPRLASKWDVNADKTVYTFTIDPKAKWHDGTPVSAEDVEFTLWCISHPQIETNRGANIAGLKGLVNTKRPAGVEKIEGVKVLDKQTVQLTLANPTDPRLVLELIGLNIWIIPKHLLKDVPIADFSKAAFWSKPVGAGPFKFKQYQTDQFVELTRNDDYHLGKPNLDSVIIKVVTAPTIVAQLEKGEVDIAAAGGIGDIPLDDWDKARSLPNVNAYGYDPDGYQYMWFNVRAGKIAADKRVRQALAHGINRKLMVDQLLKGQGIICNSPIIPATLYYNKAVEGKYPYDPAKAKALLAEAKFDMNQQVKILVPTGNKIRELHADIVQANLTEIGMKVALEKMEFATLITRLRAGDFDLAFVGWGGPLDPDVRSQYKTGGDYNYGGWSLKAMDDLLDKGAATPDTNDRKKIYDEFQLLWIEELPVLGLYWQKRLAAMNKRVQNASHMVGTFNLTRNIHEWWVSDGK